MPLGTAIHNIEITLGKGGQLARAAGAVAKLIAKEGKSATLKLPSGEVPMSATDGLTRGMDVIDTGAPLSVPVRGATLERIFNVLGEPIDNLGPVDNSTTFPIHRSAPAFIQLDTKVSIFETGIKVVYLLAPYRRGGKIGLFRGAKM
ncbi:hypothetical protein E3N88_04028 [Mikania micrantha]|uniref:H(+)-transporting two-sector ATPase n=1 Tax=Mikania micrantha TaxID=192012 RepID=A0A5N6PW38_9ASTR|nr:hypothetical protein E3N88_04028 [Mikania micrantha]